jgi:hypothetical protein
MGILSSTRTGKYAFYTEFPSTTNELIDAIERAIYKDGYTCSLNHIDVSKITDFDYLFEKFKNFNGDISNWNVNNVKYMYSMFKDSWFCSNLSNWKLNENCETYNMFFNCHLRLSKKPFKNNKRML